MLVCAYCCAFGTRDRGCQSAPGYPCALWLERANEFASLGQIMPRECDRTPFPPSSLRKQGPIRRGGHCENKMIDGFASTTTDCGYGSLLSQGRQESRAHHSR